MESKAVGYRTRNYGIGRTRRVAVPHSDRALSGDFPGASMRGEDDGVLAHSDRTAK